MASKRPSVLGLMNPHVEDNGEGFQHPVDTFVNSQARVLLLPLDRIKPNPSQPRKHFDEERIRELAESILDRDLLQPVIVKPAGNGLFLLVAGERRYRAYKCAGELSGQPERFRSIPAIVREDDELELALIENLQREDLGPLEEAQGLRALIDRFSYSQEELARKVRRSQPAISESLRLNDLPENIKADCLDAPHKYPKSLLITVAREKTPERMQKLWRRVQETDLTVAGARKKAARGKRRSRRSGVEAFCSKLDKITSQIEILDMSTPNVSEKTRMGQSLSGLIEAAQKALNRIYGGTDPGSPQMLKSQGLSDVR